MTRCWHDDPAARPSFSDICISIEHIVDTAEHLPLPVQSHTPGAPLGHQSSTGYLPSPSQSHTPVSPLDQPSPTYSNCTFDSDEEDDVTPLYRNCMNAGSPDLSTMVE